MYKFGLIKDKGTWNTPTTNIYYNNYFDGYKPIQSTECFGLINSTDGNFWLLSEDDDHYRTTCKISEETIRDIHTKLKNNDFSNSNIFSFDGDMVTIKLTNLENNKEFLDRFHKDWLNSLKIVLDIDNPIISNKRILEVWDKNIVPDKIDYPLMTPEECVYSQILKWPSLYANKDFEKCKFRVYDQLFNVLGGGYNDIEDYINTLSKKKEIDLERAKRYCNEESFDGYTEIEEIDLGTRKFTRPNFDKCEIRNIFKDEKENYPNVIHWAENRYLKEEKNFLTNLFKKESKFSPYPNFEKKYSTIWTEKELLNILSKEWIEEIIWFYESCLDAINKGCFKNYSEFPSGNYKKDLERIEDMEKRIKDKSFEQISIDYGVEYDGDTSKFLTNKWLKTKNEYEIFINETINVLNDFLNKDEIKFIER